MDPQFWENFRNPPPIYRPQYFWFLNHRLEAAELNRQIDQMRQAGAGGVFLHARHGRITPYMGDEWMHDCTAAIKHGNDTNFHVWLYDEDGFPSGFAGGKTLEPNPKDFAANFIVLLDDAEVEAGESVSLKIPPNSESSELYGVLAVPVQESDIACEILHYPESVVDLTTQIKEGNLSWAAPEGSEKWLVLIFSREWNSRAANLLSRDAMARFIQITHQRYKEELQKAGMENLLGTTIPGIFTDEPALMYCLGDKSFRRIVPFTPELESTYHEKAGITFLQGLPAVFFDLMAPKRHFRLLYWNIVADLYQASYFKQIYDWCTANHIASMGHVANEGNFFNQVRDQVDFFKGARYMHFGSSDQLGTVFRADFEKNYALALVDNMVTPRLASSAAHIYQLPRASSECFGSSGWQMTLEQQKNLIDWQVANGINLFYPHSFNYSIEGHRKGDHPPAFNICAYFEKINVLNDYIGRLCYLFSLPQVVGAEVPPRVGVIYGNQTILASMTPAMGQDAYEAHETLAYLVDLLQRLHIDFDIIPEEYIQTLAVKAGRLGDAYNEYDTIISPALNVLWAPTVSKLEAFTSGGGAVVFIRKLPGIIINDYQVDKASFEGKEKWTVIPAPALPVFKNHLGPILDQLLIAVHAHPHAIMSKTARNGNVVIRCHYPQSINATIVFAANVSAESQLQQKILLKCPRISHNQGGKIDVVFLDLHHGTAAPYPPTRWRWSPDKQGALEIDADFGPSDSILLAIGEFPVAGAGAIFLPIIDKIASLPLVQEIGPDSWEITPARHNILNIAAWHSTLEASKSGERPSYIKRTLVHEFQFVVDQSPSELKLLLDSLGDQSPGAVSLTVNEYKCKFNTRGTILDPYIWESENVAAWLKPGQNNVKIIFAVNLGGILPPLTEPLRIVGDFEAYRSGTGWRITKWHVPKHSTHYDLREEGFPHYIWPIKYTFIFEKPDENHRYFLEIPKTGAPLCIVQVNGTELPPVWFGYYGVSLENLRPGGNSIEVTYYPYPTNLFETQGTPLGFGEMLRIYRS